MSDDFEIAFLGTGSPLLSQDRCGSGQVVIAGGEHVLVDCGWGSARKLVPAGVPPATISTAVFTHMHSDHITDIPELLFLRWAVGGATTPLRVYGPTGTKRVVDAFLDALALDIGFRLEHHGEKLHPDGIRCEVTEIPATPEPHAFAEVGGLAIESFEVDHRPVVPALGFRFRFGGRTAVLSGDTGLCDSLVAAAQGADTFVCEALNVVMLEQRIAQLRALGQERQAGMLSDVPDYHIDVGDVARVAQGAGVGELVLSHIIPPIGADDTAESEFTAGMSDVYKGPIRVARDTARIAVGRRAAS